MSHQMSTPLDAAENDVKLFMISLCEALVLARNLGLEEEQRANGTFFGPNLSYTMLGSTYAQSDKPAHVFQNGLIK